MDFYVYLHRRATDGRVFYVGKGSGKRFKATSRNPFWKNTANKYGYYVEIVQSGMLEWWAFEMERELIAFYGRENLTNLTDGGDGTSGRIVGENEKRLKRERFKGQPGRVWSDEERERKRVFQTGKLHTQEAKDKVSAAKKGKPQPWAKLAMSKPESRAKVSAAKKGKVLPHMVGANSHMHRPEMKALVSARCKGVPRLDMVGAKNPSARAVRCVETGVVFETQKDAAAWLMSEGKASSLKAFTNISSVCSGKLKRAYGYVWKYA